MRENRSQFPATLGAALALTMLVGAGVANACVGSQAIATCPATCTNNCFLQQDINCSDGQGISLNAGYNLDLCGHTITCTSAQCFAAAPAVAMAGTSSKVYNTTSTNNPPLYGKIAGPWVYGVNCGNKSGSQVIGVKFDQIAGTAAFACAKVEGNIFYNSTVFSPYGVANTDRIGDNYFEVSNRAISYTGDNKISIDHNLFIETDPTGSLNTIIDVSNATHAVEVTDNILMVNGQQLIDPEILNGSTYARNFCNPVDTVCQDCISAGACEEAQPTFVFP